MPDINIDSTYGVIIIQNLKAIYVDENYAKLYGYDSPDDLLNSIDSFLDLIAPEFHELAKQNYLDIIAGKITPRGHTFHNIDRYGKEFTVFSIDHLIEYAGELALQVTVIDLSIVVEANKQIREKDLMFKRLIMNSGQGIMVHRNFKPLMLNQAWANEMRASSLQQAMETESILQFIPVEKHAEVKEHYVKTINGEVTSKSNIVENICFDGSKRFFNIYDNLIEWEGEPAVQVVLEDVTDKVEYERALAYRASHDQLTDLYNRSSIYDWLGTHYNTSTDITCMLIDIDDFKKVNDTYGHQMGDQVIKTLAGIIKKIVQKFNGVVGRWGGEEFIAFIPNISNPKTAEMAESIRVAFNRVKYQQDTVSFNASVSIGISSTCEDEADLSIDDLIKSADKYLYFAKANGKDCVVKCGNAVSSV
ncbi:sensor domain-containing diguanylate cyclase [uncultured Psychromonas sp.]|uniref:sensor domain-containing diguanylate cyclase n=1 Tax=uncultured Psychromonas sp. TaxID=173974 RepID=UPI002633D235|nr:sensor domain-containing diguanylate cyclase [uncultured Psychromonas sp.]